MGKFVVFVIAAMGGFWLSSSLFEPAGGVAGAGQMRDLEMEGCMRQMRQVVDGESFARGACDCMYDEFAARGVTLTDAFGSDFDDMSDITRQCAVRYGAQLPG